MNKWLIVGGLLVIAGVGVLVMALVFDPFGLMPPKPISFQPSKPPTAEVLALIKQVKAGSTDNRIQAMNALGDQGPDSEAAVPELIQLLYTSNEDLRLNATLTLGKLGKNAGEPLCQTMKDRNEEVRYFSVWALGLIGPDVKEKTRDVVALLDDRGDQVRRKAAETLGRIEGKSDLAVPALIKALSDSSGEVRQAASTALPKLGPDAVPALVKVLDDNNVAAKQPAIGALGDMKGGHADVIAALKKVFLQDPTLASPVSQALVKQGPAAIPVFVDGLKSQDDAVNKQAIVGLTRLGVAAAPALVDALKHPNAHIRAEAANAFQSLQVTDKLVVQSLAEALKDMNDNVRNTAFQVLYNLGPGAAGASPALAKLVEDSTADWLSRAQAARCLGMIGRQGREAIPALQKALQDKEPQLREAATWALSQMGQP